MPRKTKKGCDIELGKDEKWVLDLFTLGKSRLLSPRQITGLWENVFPGRLEALRNAIRNLERQRLVERTGTGSLILLAGGEPPGDHSGVLNT